MILLTTINHLVDLVAETPPPPDSTVVPGKQDVVIPPTMRTGVSRILGFMTWVVFSLAAAGVVFCAIRVAIAYKEGGEVLAPGLLSPMIACVIAVSASGIVGIVVF